MEKVSALDRLESDVTSSSNTSLTAPLNSSSPPPKFLGSHTAKAVDPDSFWLDEIDVALRTSFVQFLFNPEVLGLVDQYLCIYRLFPRPVVTLRSAAFFSAYAQITKDTSFILELVKTQVSGCHCGIYILFFCSACINSHSSAI